MPFAVDEHPVGALGSCAAYPPLGIAIRARGSRRGPHYCHAIAGEDRVEDAGELVSRSRIRKRKEPVRSPRSTIRLRACWAVQAPSGWADTPEDVHAPGPHLHDEQHVQALEEDRADMEEITGQQAVGLRAQERPPGGVHVPRGRLHRRARRIRRTVAFADAMAEPA